MVRVGIAGIGFMGKTHFEAYQSLTGARVEAIFTRDPAKLAGDWSGIRGNFGESGGKVDLSNIRKYNTLDGMLADLDLDLIDLCLPTHLHRPLSERALAAGKNVLVEKPIALNLADADAMIAAAKGAGRLLMVAQVLRFWPEFAAIKDLADGGEFGAIRAAHFKRVISKPDWSGGENWFSDPAKTGGAVVDLHIHDTDFVHYLFGRPDAVSSTGAVGPDGGIDYLVTQYHYSSRNLAVTAQSGAIATKDLAFEHGYEIYFERAVLRHNSSTVPTLELHTEAGEVKTLTPRISDAFAAQLEVATASVAAGVADPSLDAVSGRDSLATVLAEAESVRTGKIVPLR